MFRVRAAKYTSGREKPSCGRSPGRAGLVDPGLDRAPDVGTKRIVVTGARHEHQPLRAPESGKYALRVGGWRFPVLFAVNEKHGHGDLSRAGHGTDLVDPEMRGG